jgi:acyl-CoA synthetase (NDP forming)
VPVTTKSILTTQKRFYLLLHEYVSMGLLQEAGIRVPKFRVAETVDQVYQIASSNGFILRLFIPYTPFLF